MQSLKNKLHLGNNSAPTSNAASGEKHHLFGKHGHNATPSTGTTVTTGPAPVSAVRQTEAVASTLPRGSTVERIENRETTVVDRGNLGPASTSTNTRVEYRENIAASSIPVPPPAPAVWNGASSWEQKSFVEVPSSTAILTQQLPVQVLEKPIVVHEEVRREQVEEIQPIINIEKLKTEVHQVTQPLFDKEVRSVNLQSRTLNTEILPEVLLPGRGFSQAADVSTLHVQDTAAVVVEKPAIYNEVDKIQIIEEIQPVLYKETVVPTLIQETKPVYQKIVEGAEYSHETLAGRDLTGTQYARGFEHERVVPFVPAPAPQSTRMETSLPVQFLEKPIVVHEEVRREQVEEIQPVVQIEKLKTEVHQVTQPLFDKEVKSVNLQQRTLATEILPEVLLPGRGMARAADISSVQYQDSAAVIIEKPAVYNEVDKIQVIEEIQPVLYKETIMPTIIQETKPIYQKIVEGAVYTQQTLPARSLAGTQYSNYHTSNWTETSGMSNLNLGRNTTGYVHPVVTEKLVTLAPEKLVETTQTTTTTTTKSNANLPTYAL